MRINTKTNSLDLTTHERAILEKADAFTKILAKHGSDEIREEANKAGFHIERLRKILSAAPRVESSKV